MLVIWCFFLAIELDRLDDLAQVIRHSDSPVGEAGAADAAAAEDFVELLLVGGVIGDSRGRVFELMAGEDADDALVGADHALIAEQPGASDAGGAGRLAAEAAGRDFGFGVKHFLVADLADDAIHFFESPQTFAEVDRTVDLDGAGDRRGLLLLLVELLVVLAGDALVALAALPLQAALFVK